MSRTRAVKQCELGGRFSSCKQPVTGVCQYCGRSFCAKHGDLIEDNQEVCHRKNCVAKRVDLVDHLAYREAVFALNREQKCGVEKCERAPTGQCSRCTGYFCGVHLFQRQDGVLENQVRVMRMANLCRHCVDRRPIWARK